MYTSDGQILTSVLADSPTAAASLCCDAGAIAEAHEFNLAVVASVCISRDRPGEALVILTACGIGQERLVGSAGDISGDHDRTRGGEELRSCARWKPQRAQRYLLALGAPRVSSPP